jgi:hypothetical protein
MAPESEGVGSVEMSRGTDGVTVEQLYSELQSTGEDGGVRLAPDQRSELILDDVVETLFDGREFRFDESVVKENLNVLLLLLIAHRSSDTHGKGLMGDLATVFDARLSPGTVYPQLHDLEEEGLLEVQELVRTKEYLIDDEEALAERVTDAMEQHLALGLFLRAALSDLS